MSAKTTERQRTSSYKDAGNEEPSGKKVKSVFTLTNKWKTVKAKATRARAEADELCQRKKNAKLIDRALQLRKLVRKLSADGVHNDPEGLALLQALFSNEERKTGTWQDLLLERIDAKTAVVRRHDEAIRQNTIQELGGPSAN